MQSCIEGFPLFADLAHGEDYLPVLLFPPMALIIGNHLEQQPDDPIVLFQAADGQVSLEVRLEADTGWLSQAQMAELFGHELSAISKHIGNVFKEGELVPTDLQRVSASAMTAGSAGRFTAYVSRLSITW